MSGSHKNKTHESMLRHVVLLVCALGTARALGLTQKAIPATMNDIRLADCVDGCCRVEIFHDDKWGAVTDSLGRFDSSSQCPPKDENGYAEDCYPTILEWNEKQEARHANLACKQAGCPGNATVLEDFGWPFWDSRPGPDFVPYWMENLQCTGLEAKMQDCPFGNPPMSDSPDSPVGKPLGRWDYDDEHGDELGVCCAGGCVSGATCDTISFNVQGGLCDGMPISGKKFCGANGITDMVTCPDKVLPSLFCCSLPTCTAFAAFDCIRAWRTACG